MAEALSKIDNKALRARLYLVKNGLSYTDAMALSEEDVVAFSIIFGELDGGTFNPETQTWDEPARSSSSIVTGIEIDGARLAQSVEEHLKRYARPE